VCGDSAVLNGETHQLYFTAGPANNFAAFGGVINAR
jgi:hypothetical protein